MEVNYAYVRRVHMVIGKRQNAEYEMRKKSLPILTTIHKTTLNVVSTASSDKTGGFAVQRTLRT